MAHGGQSVAIVDPGKPRIHVFTLLMLNLIVQPHGPILPNHRLLCIQHCAVFKSRRKHTIDYNDEQQPRTMSFAPAHSF